MTGEQAAWLKAHPHYRPLGQADANSAFKGDGRAAPSTSRGVLHPDGRFELMTRGQRVPVPKGNEDAAFVVGIPTPPTAPGEPWRPGQAAPVADPRGNPNERGYDHMQSGDKKI